MRRRIYFAVLVLVIAMVLGMRGMGISAARQQPWPFEARLARHFWRFLVPSKVATASNPVLATDETLAQARAHWADHCETCHDNDGSGDTVIGHRVYPRVPDLRRAATQALTDGQLFYAIEEGIPWTAMPGWATGTPDGERETWALVGFIRHLPAVTADELREMERLNPKAPVNEKTEREIDDFLNGTTASH